MDVLRHWTAEGKTDEQLAPRHIDGEWYLHVSDCHHALAERDAALRQLAGAVEANERLRGAIKRALYLLDRDDLEPEHIDDTVTILRAAGGQ